MLTLSVQRVGGDDRVGDVDAVQQRANSVISLVLPSTTRWPSTTPPACSSAASRCTARPSPTRAPRASCRRSRSPATAAPASSTARPSPRERRASYRSCGPAGADRWPAAPAETPTRSADRVRSPAARARRRADRAPTRRSPRRSGRRPAPRTPQAPAPRPMDAARHADTAIRDRPQRCQQVSRDVLTSEHLAVGTARGGRADQRQCRCGHGTRSEDHDGVKTLHDHQRCRVRPATTPSPACHPPTRPRSRLCRPPARPVLASAADRAGLFGIAGEVDDDVLAVAGTGCCAP